jgi:hypothetical protein
LPSDCQRSKVCQTEGRCSVKKYGGCVAATDADCQNAELCKNEGKCSALYGRCRKPLAPSSATSPPG